MAGFEYKVVPAPERGLKAKGVKGTPARFAHALEAVLNEMGAQGWAYQRTDTLPVEERQGLTGKITRFQNMLVFARPLPERQKEPIAALIEDKSDAAQIETSMDDDSAPDIGDFDPTTADDRQENDQEDDGAHINATLAAPSPLS